MIKKILKSALHKPADALLASSKTLQARIDARSNHAILGHPGLTAKFYPYHPDSASYLIPKVSLDDRGSGSDLPIPPHRLWVHRYLDPVSDQYLATGKKWIDTMLGILDASGGPPVPLNRVLDFGCADGMMLRHINVPANGEAWGTDLNGELMMWCQQHLSPPYKFATTTSFPHLPFADGYFDFIYAFSVFTHICDLAEAWLLELKRIVRPGGILYLTVSDRHTIEVLFDKYPESELARQLESVEKDVAFRTSDFAFFTVNRVPGGGLEGDTGPAQVFYDTDYLAKHWSNYLEVVSINPDAYGYQTAIVLKKT